MIIGYIRVSTEKQEVENQRYSILEYSNKNKMIVDKFVEVVVSSRKSKKERLIDNLLLTLNKGDSIIVTELSRIGRSVPEVTTIVKELIDREIRLVCIKENIDTKKNDSQTKIMTTMFSLLGELERDLISQRTKEALAVLKSKGIKLGRPKGSYSKSKLDPFKEEIISFINGGMSILSIKCYLKTKRKFNVSYSTLHCYVNKFKKQ